MRSSAHKEHEIHDKVPATAVAEPSLKKPVSSARTTLNAESAPEFRLVLP